jgi:hypothetical protein
VQTVAITPPQRLPSGGCTRKLTFATADGHVEVNLYGKDESRLLLPGEIGSSEPDGLESLPLASAETLGKTFPPPCIHGDGKSLCPACQEAWDTDPESYLEYGDHPAGIQRWHELCEEMADPPAT